MNDGITRHGPTASTMLPGPAMAFQAVAMALRTRNVALDAMVYGLCRLTPPERAMLGHDAGATLLTVRPHDAHHAIGVRRHADHAALLASGGPAIGQVVVGGLGGSELGAAQLGRLVADVTGRPVVAVVPGYDRDDLVAEALGGMVLFSAAARARHAAETLRRRMVETTAGPRIAGRLAPELFATPAVAALVRLMSDPERRITLCVAHSRGVLALAAAYARLSREPAPRTFLRAAQAQVVTLGCVAGFPPGVAWTHQALGTLDVFGALNSRDDLAFERIAGAGHHLNPSLPMHLDLPRLLKSVLHGRA